MADISVFVIDDSALMRKLVSKIIFEAPGLTVVDTAENGQVALEKLQTIDADIIVLDIEMPVMTGIDFLHERKKRGISIPVIMLSSVAKEGARISMECLELGASDFVTKPSGSDSPDIRKVASRLTELLLSYGSIYARTRKKNIDFSSDALKKIHEILQSPIDGLSSYKEKILDKAHNQSIDPIRPAGKIEVIVIGISTGGPVALRDIFAKIDPALTQPIIVVQHMPAGFTEEFARNLNKICPLTVKEAEEGEFLKAGHIFIAPGSKHVTVEKRLHGSILHLNEEPLRNGHRPSADVLFESVAGQYHNNALGIIMTGMGRDGAEKLAEMRRQGAYTIGQDQASSTVYGMPRVAFEYGAVQQQVSLYSMADTINSFAKRYK
ncbi:MAG: protein-glutamate methylesterase/protein-glutamine glutaminase [Treponemataceae bacterium]